MIELSIWDSFFYHTHKPLKNGKTVLSRLLKVSRVLNQYSYIKIRPFMLEELKLKGTALLVYATIYGFSKNNQQFIESIEYLKQWTNSTKPAISRVLTYLIKSGYIKRTEYILNGKKYYKYSTTR